MLGHPQHLCRLYPVQRLNHGPGFLHLSLWREHWVTYVLAHAHEQGYVVRCPRLCHADILPGLPCPKSQALLSRETRRIKRTGAEGDLVAVVIPITVAIRVIRVSPKGGFIAVSEAVGIAVGA